jgi:hypothetical protein
MEELQHEQFTAALLEVALTEGKAMSVRLAEVIAYVQKKEHLAALATFSRHRGAMQISRHRARSCGPAAEEMTEVHSQLNMEEYQMNAPTLKTILQLNPATRRYVAAGHNLTAEKADECAATLRGKGCTVFVLDQPIRHKGRGHNDCLPCRSAAERLTEREGQNPDESTTEASAASEA